MKTKTTSNLFTALSLSFCLSAGWSVVKGLQNPLSAEPSASVESSEKSALKVGELDRLTDRMVNLSLLKEVKNEKL